MVDQDPDDAASRRRRAAGRGDLVALATVATAVAALVSTPAGVLAGVGATLVMLLIRRPNLRELFGGLGVTVIAVAIIVCTLAGMSYLAIAALQHGSSSSQDQEDWVEEEGANKRGGASQKESARETAGGAKKDDRGKTERGTGREDLVDPPSRPQTKWSDLCPLLPGADAPGFAAEQLKRLYLGPQLDNADPPPGAEQGGCTGLTTVIDGHFAFLEGKDDTGALKSVAVVSKLFGPAIFLAPAAKRVRKLIDRYRDIGGWLRTRVGRGGDYYGVRSPLGTCILMRPAPVLADGSGRTQGYVVLPPAAATLWMQTMRRYGSWLWALPGGLSNGKQRIRLVSNLQSTTVVETLFVDHKTDTARVASQRSWRSAYGVDLDQDEVKRFAAGAR